MAVSMSRSSVEREIENARISVGESSDGRGRWAVVRVVDRRTELGVREALVEWEGDWPDSWVSERFLSRDLRRSGGLRSRGRADEAVTDETRTSGTRKSPRLAGDTPAQGL